MQDQQKALSIATEASAPTVTTTNNSPSSGTVSTPSPQQNNSEQNNTQQSSNNSNSNECPGETTSYEQLGIITERPKRPEYADYQTRLNSFNEWPEKNHMKPKDLANAGFFYTGEGDSNRCFYCNHCLRNWDPGDDVWVEHARWFPKCAFLRQEVGNEFIQTVQAMSEETDEIKYDDVIRRMQDTNAPSLMTLMGRLVERDPAVQTVTDYGFSKGDICKLAVQSVKTVGEQLTTEKLYEAAKAKNLEVNKESNSKSDSQNKQSGEDKETTEKFGDAIFEF